MRPVGLFALPDHLARLSKTGDPLEVLDQIVDFEQFWEPLERALGYADGSKGGCPPYDPEVMFKILILVARLTVRDERMEFLIRDRLSWQRFPGFDGGLLTTDGGVLLLREVDCGFRVTERPAGHPSTSPNRAGEAPVGGR